MAEGVLPVITVINPANPLPGSQVTVTVTTVTVKTGERVMAISQTPAAYFSDIPIDVTVPDGQDEVQFTATVATTASGQGTITASCNGSHASGSCIAQS